VQDDHLVFCTFRVAAGGAWDNPPTGWRFLLIQQGKGLYESASVAHAVGPGDVLVLRGTTNGTLRAQSPGELTACYFRFYPEQLVGLLNLAERALLESMADQGSPFRLFPAPTPFARQFSTLASQPPIPGTLAHRCLVLQLVAALLAEEAVSTPTTAHLPEHANDRIREIARKCGCSRRHLNRLFRENFGKPFASLKMELRLEKAAVLLRASDAKIISVALDCGFNHLGLFSAKFKRRFGASPSKWRTSELPFDQPKPRDPDGRTRPLPGLPTARILPASRPSTRAFTSA
jgi:AraC-like DNA-binding protein